MKDEIISKIATLLNADGFITHQPVEVAYYTEDDGDEYIRVGSSLYWRKDIQEDEDRFTCLASGATILF